MSGGARYCPVCGAAATPLPAVDFNKSCEEANGRFLPPSGIFFQYFLCGNCGFCFAPEICSWTTAEFENRIYNKDYAEVDPDCSGPRPRANAANLIELFGERRSEIRHLDYGGGSGLLSELLHKAGWNSTSYDPFHDKGVRLGDLGKFDLITAYEVFEHVPDVTALMSDLRLLLAHDGIVLFSTLLSDGKLGQGQGTTWWYASPRNGHISLFSRKSLAILAAREGWTFGSFSPVSHVLWRTVPSWASHVFRTAAPLPNPAPKKRRFWSFLDFTR